MQQRLRQLCAVLALAGALPAQAALFSDDEARKAILELRAKVTALEEAQKRLASSQDVQDQLQTLRRSLLEISNQNEALRAEMARLRGANEQLTRDLADTQRRLSDQLQGFDARIKQFEPQKVALDGQEFKVEPEEQRQYEAAMGLLRRGEFAQAASAYESFLKRFSASGYGAVVRFWLGNAQYGQRAYAPAIATFREFLKLNPQHPRVPEALLALANCQIELKDSKSARKTLDELIKAHPGSEAAQAAKERRASLK
ncbi:tol-pal system protein YbgF [Inhella sp.]|uniref:tol-pal system protein YbgF n=1 Tax=Inhella sp. TaxID=1921806 RepID=UPI0035B4EA6E